MDFDIVSWEPEGRYLHFKDVLNIENQKDAITAQSLWW